MGGFDPRVKSVFYTSLPRVGNKEHQGRSRLQETGWQVRSLLLGLRGLLLLLYTPYSQCVLACFDARAIGSYLAEQIGIEKFTFGGMLFCVIFFVRSKGHRSLNGQMREELGGWKREGRGQQARVLESHRAPYCFQNFFWLFTLYSGNKTYLNSVQKRHTFCLALLPYPCFRPFKLVFPLKMFNNVIFTDRIHSFKILLKFSPFARGREPFFFLIFHFTRQMAYAGVRSFVIVLSSFGSHPSHVKTPLFLKVAILIFLHCQSLQTLKKLYKYLNHSKECAMSVYIYIYIYIM